MKWDEKNGSIGQKTQRIARKDIENRIISSPETKDAL
jgi:hypothetical protein